MVDEVELIMMESHFRSSFIHVVLYFLQFVNNIFESV